MPIGVGHAVAMTFEVVAFDELNTLIAKAEVVAVLAQVTALDRINPAVVVDRHAI